MLALSVLFAVLLVAAAVAAEDVVDNESMTPPSTCHPALSNFTAGSMTREILLELSSAVGGSFAAPLQWLANAELFSFRGHDNLTLQAYGMKGSNHEDEDLPVLVYCAGWTETTVKYAPFLYDLSHVHGYTVYSFDFRGQGFSASTMLDKGRVTHIESFKEYIADLKLFADHIAARHRRHAGTEGQARRLVYVGNSLSGLVGLSVQQQHPGTFARLALAAPVIKPLVTLNQAFRLVLYWIHRLGFGKVLPVRLGGDILGLKLTHHQGNFDGWRKLRGLAPDHLIVQGPSISWLSSLTEQGHELLAASAQRPSTLTSPLLLLVAEHDLFVDNESIFQLAHAYEGHVKIVKLVGSWHELWTEHEDIYNLVKRELLDFLSLEHKK